ncbi:MAG: hypothetical protein U5N26_08570 [Candidatus Marinimicrobia bacterium]|nr:hypothetical protein [Candidatus Neomarinimicrobiota bacterium]
MKEVQRIGKINEAQAYRLWNMGNGMLIVADKKEAGRILSYAKAEGYAAKICGSITAKTQIVLETKGLGPQKIIYGS